MIPISVAQKPHFLTHPILITRTRTAGPTWQPPSSLMLARFGGMAGAGSLTDTYILNGYAVSPEQLSQQMDSGTILRTFDLHHFKVCACKRSSIWSGTVFHCLFVVVIQFKFKKKSLQIRGML
uniref:Uncharacterized protein n=1 Tax=Arundo donax TaxID=35708 RepID=A0A0A9HZ88_ARUDO